MSIKKISFEYREYAHFDQLEEEESSLIRSAIAATQDAYAPYSGFKVGASVRLEDGTIIKGSNQENASYPLCICAEANVLSNCGSNFHDKTIMAIAVSVIGGEQIKDKPVSPCGACRQIISEYQHRQKTPFLIYLTSESGRTFVIESIYDLLPLSFSSEYL